mmetsp:Transcript_50521/g.132869  ORF Transcript_50521/g.132869 Transcript_50521/m.132869 type:complete len:80 (+) Transcript_50521:1196-1435(+)
MALEAAAEAVVLAADSTAAETGNVGTATSPRTAAAAAAAAEAAAAAAPNEVLEQGSVAPPPPTLPLVAVGVATAATTGG